MSAILPIALLEMFFTTFPMPLTTPLTALPTPLKAFLTDLKAFLIKYSGSPVSGLIVPEPPLLRSILASEGVI